MRRSVLLSIVAVSLLLSISLPQTLADTTLTLRFEMSPSASGEFAVENLAGAMRIRPASGGKVVAVATVHAESEELAGLLRLEEVKGKNGEPILRVHYPLDKHTTYRYPAGSRSDWGHGWLFGNNLSTTTYAGHKVRVSSSKGVLLYADVEVQVPAGKDGVFRNYVGALHGKDVTGKLSFDGSSAPITLDHVGGEIRADTGSGDIHASDVEGSLTCDTGSGNIDLRRFRGDALVFDTGSGDIAVSETHARSLRADTGSGEVRVSASGLVSFDADTGSGDISLDTQDIALERVRAETGSGDVSLRMGPNASFEATADQGSGDIISRYDDAQPIVEGREVVGYRRGSAKTKIHVETGSGDLVLEPGG